MQLLDLQVDSSAFQPSAHVAPLARLARRVESEPQAVLPELLVLAADALAGREFPVAVMSLLLAAKAGYEASALDAARAAGVRAVECARQTGDQLGEAHAYRLLALIAFDQGRSKDGHDHLLDAIAAFDDAGQPGEVPVLMRWYGEHLACLGAVAEARQAFEVARDRFAVLGDRAAAQSCEEDLKALAQRAQ